MPPDVPPLRHLAFLRRDTTRSSSSAMPFLSRIACGARGICFAVSLVYESSNLVATESPNIIEKRLGDPRGVSCTLRSSHSCSATDSGEFHLFNLPLHIASSFNVASFVYSLGVSRKSRVNRLLVLDLVLANFTRSFNLPCFPSY